MDETEKLVMPLLELCREAGDAVRSHYHAPGSGELEPKSDDSPLTQADLASDRLLKARLAPLAGGLPVLSEESSPRELTDRRKWTRYWLVDPLDGTKEFLAGSGEFTINIALIDTHEAVLGVVYLPLKDAAYVGIPGATARRYTLDDGGNWRAQPISVRSLEAGRPLAVLVSRRHRGRRLQQCLDWLGEHWGNVERHDSGSALKFCQLAAGEGDFYPRFSPCCEWDTAAGQAVLEAAGGVLLDTDGDPLRYNLHESLYSPHFFALADPTAELWAKLLRKFSSKR